MLIRIHFFSPRRLALIAIHLVMPAVVYAQIGSRPIQGSNRPSTSPYLGLLNANGNSPAINYYTQVRPQRQLRAGAAELQREIDQLGARVDEGVTYDEMGIPSLPQSGHPTTFMNHRGYFGSGTSALPKSSNAGARSGGNRPASRPPGAGAAGRGGRPPGVGSRAR